MTTQFARFEALALSMGVTVVVGPEMPDVEGVPRAPYRTEPVLRGARVVRPNVVWLLNKRPEALAQGVHELLHAIEWSAGFWCDETIGRWSFERHLAERAGLLTAWELWIRGSAHVSRRGSRRIGLRSQPLFEACSRKTFDRALRMFRHRLLLDVNLRGNTVRRELQEEDIGLRGTPICGMDCVCNSCVRWLPSDDCLWNTLKGLPMSDFTYAIDAPSTKVRSITERHAVSASAARTTGATSPA